MNCTGTGTLSVFGRKIQHKMSVIKKTYNLNGLEIDQFDFLDPMTYDEDVSACSKLGEGWILPTRVKIKKYRKELKIIS